MIFFVSSVVHQVPVLVLSKRLINDPAAPMKPTLEILETLAPEEGTGDVIPVELLFFPNFPICAAPRCSLIIRIDLCELP
mmetsp:Transcript_15878/g.20899  ORF Transcript_15878/g.20899 Transcript_15878/m.20899 type:complete len:80 (+) Transcript_15878:109-348(+)